MIGARRDHRRGNPRRLDPAEVKARVNPAAFYRDAFPGWTPRKTEGWTPGPLCPFHDDRRPGSFNINLSSGAFRCFACGARGGDVIAFVMLRDNLAFPEALRALTREGGR